MALREVISIQGLLKEMVSYNLIPQVDNATIKCKVFEDNAGALELATAPKIRPRTKHINVKYHHFREAVSKGEIIIQAIASEDQLADILTKPLPEALFLKHRLEICGY